jgi:hypothetical protein
VTVNKELLAGNSGTTWKTKHPWIWILFRNVAIVVEILITEQNNEKMPTTIIVPTTLLFPLFYMPQIKGHQAKACSLSVIRHHQYHLPGYIIFLYDFIFCGLAQCNKMQWTWKLLEHLKFAN